jgi:hypothetical protein
VIGGEGSRARDVNNAGTVVGVGSNKRPAIWIDGQGSDLLALSCAGGGPAPLCAEGVTGVAQAINERGQAVGYLEGLPDGAPLQAVVFTFVPAAAGAAPLVARHAGRCLDVPGRSRDWGTQLILWDCHGLEHQQFTYPAVGQTGEIRVYGGVLCIDAASGQGNNGDPIIIWGCHGGANQQWARLPTGEFRGIKGRCLDVSGGATGNAAPLILWDCHGGDNQRFDPGAGGAAVARAALSRASAPPLLAR